MFLETLLETTPAVRTRRGVTTMASFGAQAFGVLFLIAMPLLFPDALPLRIVDGPVTAPTAPPAAEHNVADEVKTNLVPVPSELTETGALQQPITIPTRIYTPEKPEQRRVGFGDYSGPVVVGAIPGPATATHAVLTDVIKTAGNGQVVKHVVPVRPRISQGVSEGLLIHRVTPVYPKPAIAMRVEGDVLLQATIGASGEVESLRVAAGHPLLAPAALEAVRDWRYRPYMLNNEPVPVETQIVVKFRLRTAQ